MVRLIRLDMKKPKRIKMNRADLIFTIFNTGFQIFCILIVIYPLIYIVSASFSSPQAVLSGLVKFLPVDFSLEGYKAVFRHRFIMSGYMNTIIYTAFGTMLSVTLTIMAGYPLSRRDFYGNKVLMFFFTFTMLFSGGMIPGYLLIYSLGLIDSRLAMIIPGALSAWYVIIARTFFRTTVPDELYEAALLDGCSDIKFLLKIVLPISKAIVAVLILFYAVSKWNSYMAALLYLRTPGKYPLQLILRSILILSQIQAEMLQDLEEIAFRQGLEALLKYSLIVVASAPMLILYPFIQKHFVKGMMIGSLKG